MINKLIASRKFTVAASLMLGFAMFIAILPVSSAGSASLSIKSSGSFQSGKTFSVNIYENSNSERVDSVQADITFDASKIECVSINDSGSPFDFGIEDGCSAGSGEVGIGKTILDGSSVTGEHLIAKITFKMKATSGTHAVSFRSSSAIVNDADTPENIWNGVTTGAQFTATAPTAASQPPKQTNDPPASTTPEKENPTPQTSDKPENNNSDDNSSNNDNTPTDTTKTSAAIKDSRLDKVTFTGAKFSLVSDVLTSAKLTIRSVDSEVIQTVASPELNFQHLLSVDDLSLTPGSTYEYQFIAEDAAGNEVKSEPKLFTTLGYRLEIVVTDTKGRAVANTDVELRSEPRNAKTDNSGKAVFENVAPGVHTLSLTVGEGVYSQQIVVDDTLNVLSSVYDGTAPELQAVSVALPYEIDSGVSPLVIVALLGAAVIVALVFISKLRSTMLVKLKSTTKIFSRKKKHNKNYANHTLEQIEKDVHAKHNKHSKHMAPPAIVHPEQSEDTDKRK